MTNHRHAPGTTLGSFVATTGQNRGHQWAGFMAAGGQKPMSLDIRIRRFRL